MTQTVHLRLVLPPIYGRLTMLKEISYPFGYNLGQYLAALNNLQLNTGLSDINDFFGYLELHLGKPFALDYGNQDLVKIDYQEANPDAVTFLRRNQNQMHLKNILRRSLQFYLRLDAAGISSLSAACYVLKRFDQAPQILNAINKNKQENDEQTILTPVKKHTVAKPSRSASQAAISKAAMNEATSTVSEASPQSQAESQAESGSGSQSGSQSVSQAESESQSQAQSNAKSQTESQAESNAVSQVQANAKSQAQSQAQSNAESQVQSNAESQAQAQSNAESQVEEADDDALTIKIAKGKNKAKAKPIITENQPAVKTFDDSKIKEETDRAAAALAKFSQTSGQEGLKKQEGKKVEANSALSGFLD